MELKEKFELLKQTYDEIFSSINEMCQSIADGLVESVETYGEAINELSKMDLDDPFDRLVYQKIHQRMVKEKSTSEDT